MPKPLKKVARKRDTPLPEDVNERAAALVRLTTGESQPISVPATPVISKELRAYMKALGKIGGQIGGKRRLDTLSAERRSEIASRAARARWAEHKRSKRR